MLRTSDRTHTSFESYVPRTFFDMLRALEYLYGAMPSARAALDALVVDGLANAPCNLQLRWEAGRLMPAGAEILDRSLVSPALQFLVNAGITGAAAPLDRALRALLDGRRDPARYKDADRDADEAIV